MVTLFVYVYFFLRVLYFPTTAVMAEKCETLCEAVSKIGQRHQHSPFRPIEEKEEKSVTQKK